MRFSGAIACVLALLASAALAAEAPASYIITIQNVELKNHSGEWVSVVEPDRQADVLNDPAEVSFINRGRVETGDYVNFRIAFLEPGQLDVPRSLTAARDFAEPLTVKKTSFIHAQFDLDVSKRVVDAAAIHVDDQERILNGAELILR